MTFYAKDLTIELTKTPKQKPQDKTKLKFGSTFTDHMLCINYDEPDGWGKPKIIPYQNLSLDPACSVFHYAIECFEGMKIFKDKDNNLRFFRADKNAQRMLRTAKRLGLPQFDENEFIECLRKFIEIEKEWIPDGVGYSLYVRPTYISTYKHVGVAPPKNALLYVILSPVGPYFPTGFTAVKLMTSSKYVRACHGGMGAYKCGGNYAAGILPQIECNQQGCSQILWLLDGLCTEVGTMNFFILWKNLEGKTELVTAPVDDVILPGVTRDSMLQIAKETFPDWVISERYVHIDELIDAIKEKRVLECFGTGTACVVTPVKCIKHNDIEYDIPLDPNDSTKQTGPYSEKLYQKLTDIQYGKTNKPEWSSVVCKL